MGHCQSTIQTIANELISRMDGWEFITAHVTDDRRDVSDFTYQGIFSDEPSKTFANIQNDIFILFSPFFQSVVHSLPLNNRQRPKEFGY